MLTALMKQAASLRASPENPSTNLSNPSEWLVDWFGGGQASSGVPVNPETALKYGPVFAAVSLISRMIGSMPLHVFKRLPDGKGKERFPQHPVYRLLHDQPNEEMTAIIFRELLSCHLLLWGNAFAYIEKNNAGTPTALLPLLPDRTWAERKNGKLRYITTVNNQRIVLSPDKVLHVPGLSFDGLSGKSPITLARETIGLGIAAEKYGAAFFGNSANPGGVIEHPGKLSADAQARLRESWAEKHQGIKNSHKPAILEEGMKFNQFTLSQKDSQFLETRKFGVVEVARWFNVPPSLIGDLERAILKNAEQQSLWLLVYNLTPSLTRYEQEYNRKLFREDEKAELFAEHDTAGLMRGDQKSRYEAYRSAVMVGWMTRNEARVRENMNPLEGLDDPLQPLNMLPVGDEPPQDDPGDDLDLDIEEDADEEDSLRKIMAPVLHDAARRIVKREVSELRRSLKKRSGAEFDSWADGYYKEFRDVIIKTLRPFSRDAIGLDDITTVADSHIAESRTLLKLCASRTAVEGSLNAWEVTRPTQLQTLCGDTIYEN